MNFEHKTVVLERPQDMCFLSVADVGVPVDVFVCEEELEDVDPLVLLPYWIFQNWLSKGFVNSRLQQLS